MMGNCVPNGTQNGWEIEDNEQEIKEDLKQLDILQNE